MRAIALRDRTTPHNSGGRRGPNTRGCREVRSRWCAGARSGLDGRSSRLHRRSITGGRDRQRHRPHGQSEKLRRATRGDRWRRRAALRDIAAGPVHIRVGHDGGCQRTPQRTRAAPVDIRLDHGHQDQAGDRSEPGTDSATASSHATTTGASTPTATGADTATSRADSASAGASARAASAAVDGAARAGVSVQALS